MHYTYIIKCSDNTLYTGYTNDLKKRIKAHNEGKGAKYTKPATKRPVKLVYYEEYEDKHTALSREAKIKKLTRKEKIKIIKDKDMRIKNINEALDYIHSTNKFGSKLGLDNIRELLKRLGNPEKKLKIIHVAGTNAKGSVCTMLSNILQQSGYKTGLYISPYLEEFNERIQLNNTPISNDDLVIHLNKVKMCIDNMVKEGLNHPTEFEIITALALDFFKDKTDVVVLETGLGGRLDATNAVLPILSVITPIGFDHMQYLGNTLEEIALEKAKIIKENTPVISAIQKDNVLKVIEDEAKKQNSTLFTADKNLIGKTKFYLNHTIVNFKKNTFDLKQVKLNLLGKNQVENLSIVIKVCEVLTKLKFNITKKNIKDALNKTHFSGRFELLNTSHVIIIDAAHNEMGMKSLKENIMLYFDKKITLFIGMLEDKEVDKAIDLILPLTKEVFTLTPNNDRALDSSKMTEKIKKNDKNIKVTTLKKYTDVLPIINNSGNEDIFIFAGSLYMIGDMRKIIRER